MSLTNKSQVIMALSIAAGIFLIAIVIPKLLLSKLLPTLLTTQGLELILSLLAIMIFGKRKFSDYGFCWPRLEESTSKGKFRWVLISLTAPLLGIAATVSILGLGGSGNPLVRQLTLPQIVLIVWIFSSTIEEIFTRGFLQGHLSILSGRYLKLGLFRIELPVLISALFFACMHFVLFFSGVDAITMVVVFLFTLFIGLMAGHLRARTGSLIPAITVHMLANIGGMVGGVIYSIINFMTTGTLPKM